MKRLFYMLYAAFFNICRIFPLKNNRVTFLSPHREKFTDSLGMVLKEVESRGGFDVVRISSADLSLDGTVASVGRALSFFTRKAYLLATSKYVFLNDNFMPMSSLHFSKDAVITQLWHAEGVFKKFGLDAPSRLKRAEEIATHSQYSAVAVTSEHCRKYFAGAFGIGEEVCLPIGLPRTDFLINGSSEMRNRVFERHPELRGKKIYLYCPTFREIKGNKIVYDPQIDWARLSGELRSDEMFVIRRHPIMDYKLCGGEYTNIIDLSDESTLELTAACDVLISDYSSVIYDACLLDVPMVFYCPDYKEYERGFYLKFPDDLPGETVTESENLISAVRQAKENPPVSRIEKFRKEQMSACDGSSTQRAVELILSWLK